MNSHVWIYFSKTGVGYELVGTDVISGIDAFIHGDATFLVEYSHSDMMNDMHFFIYEWDKSQKKRRTIFEGYQRQNVLTGFAKNVDIPENLKLAIFKNYTFDEEDLELEKMQTPEY